MKTNVAPASCPQCGGPIPAEAREGLCPRCALAAVAAATETGRPGEPSLTAPTREAVAAALPQFEILEFIGQGGMGCVFKARQPQLDRVVALKILPAVPGREPKFTDRFLREAKALARMSHPNIVTVHDSGEAGGFFYLVMEYVDGVSLRQLLRERRLASEEALAIVPRICEALQFAHGQGVVHRDIKPENVLLDKQGRVKIADFGIAKLVGSTGPGGSLVHSTDVPSADSATPVGEESALTRGHVLGTPSYMAPEQVERPGMVDHRADIYSLGVVFYEMLTGELPSGEFPPPSQRVQIDVRLDEIVLRALEKKPERRYQQASEVKTQVERITATPSPRGVPGHKPSLDPGQLTPAMPGAAPWVALGATVTYAGTLLFGLLGTVVRGGVPGGWLVVVFALLVCASPLMILALQRFVSPEGHRTVFKIGGGLALVTALPIVGFAIFFLLALISESGGWHPAPDEVVLVPLIWLGAVLLPGCGWWLTRGVTRPNPNPANANPLPLFDFWLDLEAGEYARAWDRSAAYLQEEITRDEWVTWMKATRRPLGNAVSREQLSMAWIGPGRRFVQSYVTSFANQQSMRETVFCALQPDGGWKVEKYQLEPSSERSTPVRASDRQLFAAMAVAAMLLLTASGNATVMLIGAAVLLVVGLAWLPPSRWRIALLVALASMGVAGFTVLVLNRMRPATADNSVIPTTETRRLNASIAAPELTVAQDGSGTHESIQAALADAVEDTVIRIGPGRYEAPLLITNSVSLLGAGWEVTVIGPTTPAAPPTPKERQELDRQFRAANTDEERNRLRSEARHRFFKPVVQVRNAAKVSFEGIKFALPGSPPEGTLQDSTVIEIGEAHAHFDACAIVGSPGNGIVLSEGGDVAIRNTLVAAVWNSGIRVERGTKSKLTVIDSDIRNCHYAGIVVGRGQSDVTIGGCRVSGAAWHGIRYDHASPRISGCLIFANARSGIYASGSTAAQVQGNVFWKNEMDGVSCWFENRDALTHNTFAANLREGLSVLGASSPGIERNVFWEHPQGIVQGNIGDNSPSAKATAPLRLQNNLFWANEVPIASALDVPPGDTNGPASIPLDAFPGQVKADPGFRDPVNGDFSLLPHGAAATLAYGAQSALQPISPWPLQPEERAIIPEGHTRDSRQWKRTP